MTTPPPMRQSPQPNGFWTFLRVFGRGLNIVRLVLINLVFFGFLFLFMLLILGIGAAKRSSDIQDSSVLVLKPEGRLVEQYSINPMQRAISKLSGDEPKEVQLRDLTGAIDAAAKDPRITRIVLNPDQLQSSGFAALTEVGAALDRFRASGKPVVAWASSLDQYQYLLAAHADRILLDPQGGLLITGLANYRLFYKDLLDKLGVDVHLFRVGQFKSAAEPFILDHASPESKEADSYWMGGLWDGYINTIAKLRKLDPNVVRADINELPDRIASTQGDLAKLALDEHLIDGLATRDELIETLRSQGVPAGKDGHGIRGVNLDRYAANIPSRNKLTGSGVTVVVAEGEITSGEQPAGSIGGESTAALIRSAREDKRTKALVLRVNSPGGEVYAAEEIRREVEQTRKAGIPVIVSMGDVAASGGYWISMNADKIYAEPNTITGSIGIFGMYYTIPNTLAKLGINSDGVGTSPLAGAFDISRPLDPKIAGVIQSVINKGYHDFVGGVAQARGKDYAAIDAIAQGRVWTGDQAMQRGLVDQLGGFDAAVSEAADLAHLGKDYAVRYQEKPLGAFERFVVSLNQSAMVSSLQSYGVKLPSWVAQLPMLAPELQMLRTSQAGQPNVYSYCFCSAH
ncbi:signal peptide peptidase SppA [Dyella caseinilytica]|uniref:Signal peptide peptidase SppA n=1 Tax=Dyella caseinilytica TaxID=1849581 RepID=A0ABX7GRX8_9GAMM|nr:signal peptide peptidase SppA [Dyella caseinilytica]QRN53194.1 signal peptide peptidase SppA [Dyella caseinilytica]GGA12172.1 protease [Dyella caseinilytica]